MGSPQLAYTNSPAAGRPGALGECLTSDAVSVWIGETDGVEPGLLLVRDGLGSAVLPSGQALDVDAIMLATATTASDETYVLADFNGAYGVAGGPQLTVPAAVTLTLNNHTDWDATTATVTGKNAEGTVVTEDVSIPDGGDATLTTTNKFVTVTQITIPTQTGTNGSFTAGFAASDEIGLSQIYGVAALDHSKPPPTLLPDNERAAAWRRGRVWVATEAQVAEGARAFVRIFAGVGEQLGSFRADADGSDAVAVPGARFVQAPTAALALLEVNFSG